MNDPGLDEPVADADKQVSNAYDEKNKEIGPEEEEQSFLLPARWWYASTAIPLTAGTFGPMANAFSICALVENWRVKVPKGGTEEHGIDIQDPKWLIAVNAVSLVCALLANLALLLNMARRVPFHIAQPITILGFWVASVLLIGLIAKAGTNFHAPGVNDQALSQAYYYAIFAAGMYQIISYLMLITVYGAWKGHYSKEFKLTVAQRTLMLQTISFLVYQLIWALVYSHVEGWKLLDAVYWSDFTSLTIGIGIPYTPATHLGRSLLFPMALGGIVILGLVVGSIRSLVLDRGKKKMAARMTEKTRRRLIAQIEQSMKEDNAKRFHFRGIKNEMVRALTLRPGAEEILEKDRRQYEFEAMRRVQRMAATERKYFSLLTSIFAFAFLWTMGAYVFYKAEKDQGWTYFESFYFSYTTLLTIGYGDFQPLSNAGKPFFVFWSLLAVPTLTILISNMGDTVVKGIKEVTIYFGEITILPSTEARTRDRLKYGLYRSTFGQAARQGKAADEESFSSPDGKAFEELHPGLARVFGQRASQKLDKKTRAAGERLASDFEEEEKIDEEEAKGHGDLGAADVHHYRRLLLSEIRRAYTDSMASTPKNYSYAEWSYFLRLLGEDESDVTRHRTATGKSKKEKRHRTSHHSARSGREQEAEVLENAGRAGQWEETSDDETQTTKWSWIGHRSPLMSDKDEPEWLLEHLMRRLEESLHPGTLAKEQKHEQRLSGECAPPKPTQTGNEAKVLQRDGQNGSAQS